MESMDTFLARRSTLASRIHLMTPQKHEPSLDYIESFCQVKPFDSTQTTHTISVSGNILSLTDIQPESKYEFQKILGEDPQENIVMCLYENIMQSVLYRSQNVLLFNYGTTNSGKTFTAIGTPEQPGVLRKIFRGIRKSFKIVAVEIVDNRWFSLTDPKSEVLLDDHGFQFLNFEPSIVTPENKDFLLQSIISNRGTFNTGNSLSHAIFHIMYDSQIITVCDLAGGTVSNDSPGFTLTLNQDLVELSRVLMQREMISGNALVRTFLRLLCLPKLKVMMLVNVSTSEELKLETSKTLFNSDNIKTYHPNYVLDNTEVEKYSLLPVESEGLESKNKLCETAFVRCRHNPQDTDFNLIETQSMKESLKETRRKMKSIEEGVILEAGEEEDEVILQFKEAFGSVFADLVNQEKKEEEFGEGYYEKRKRLVRSLRNLYKVGNFRIKQLELLNRRDQQRKSIEQSQTKQRKEIDDLTEEILQLHEELESRDIFSKARRRSIREVATSPIKFEVELPVKVEEATVWEDKCEMETQTTRELELSSFNIHKQEPSDSLFRIEESPELVSSATLSLDKVSSSRSKKSRPKKSRQYKSKVESQLLPHFQTIQEGDLKQLLVTSPSEASEQRKSKMRANKHSRNHPADYSDRSSFLNSEREVSDVTETPSFSAEDDRNFFLLDSEQNGGLGNTRKQASQRKKSTSRVGVTSNKKVSFCHKTDEIKDRKRDRHNKRRS